MITYNFHSTDTLIGNGIKTYTKSNFNHVSISIMGYVFEADIKKGVVKVEEKDFDYSTVVTSITLHKINNIEQVFNWLNGEVGKGYDLIGVFSFIWRFLPNRIGRWYCSEYAKVSLAKALNVYKYNQKVTPQGLYEELLLIKAYE